MAVIYKKNAQNVYKIPLYRFFWFWWLLVVSLAVLSSIIGLVVSIKAVQFALWSLVCEVSDQREVNQNVHHAKRSRTSYHKEPTRNNVSQSTARYSIHLCSAGDGRRKPTVLRKSEHGKAPRHV